ncbi:hypothetical protein VTO58DRAFT_109485 [Aureobasidium pullulans]|uniref:Amino acid transporter n=1 Tax=Aureobasidium pullulans TaxID=5580 RepID=A0A4S9EVR7_AURPU|nr:hypothetical protein JADG_001828 [Aureobasidium pullulans]THX05642.1 amino acid transporter [Aureobasidium pullulans]THX38730.1 amino acid transporter [Aureobasidium pullulans]THX48238.1 amino acid transporter [Aureobasidium pullulans]
MENKTFEQQSIPLDGSEISDYASGGDGQYSRDELDMIQQGKTQRFQRNFGLVSLLGFGTTMMATWEAVFTSNATAALNGGFPSLVWGFLFSWIGNLATAASLAEMASMAPTSGGQYHWVAMLAPEKHRVFLSWITGWIATIGWSANTAAGIFFSGSMIQGLLVLNDSTYAYHRWHGTLIMWAALGIVILVNTIAARFLPKIEGMILILHTLGFFAILIPMVYLSDHNSASTVFTDFENSAGWNSNGLAFFVGLISNTLPFIGYDGPAHMAEEVKNAAINVPYAMIFTVIVNGTLGFAITIAFAFCATDIQSALESPTGYDFMYVFQQATQSNAGTSVMTAIMIVLMICASIGFLATASRQTFAFARDRGIPGSRWLSTVGTTTKIPFWSVVFCTFITMLICLINIFSTVAFNAIVSLTIAGLFISYLIPVSLMAFKRATGEPIKWGPWKMGSLGLPVNIVSMIYLIITIVFSFFAPETPVTLASMNWSCLVFGGFVIIGLVYWFVTGRKVYTGPIRER